MLQVSLLGEQRVADGEEPLPGLSQRTLGLLGYLVVHAGAPQLRSHVAVLFWPDSIEEQARTNLRRELHQLRRALPDPDRCLAIDASSVHWRADAAAVDVLEFERAADEATTAGRHGDMDRFVAAAGRAIQIYGGPFMPGYYDDWVLAERDRLHRCCVALVDQLVPVLAAEGPGPQVLDLARRRIELEPLEESGYRTLMVLQADAGDRGAALGTFHRCAAVLEGELGLDPSEDTLAVQRRLLGAALSADGPARVAHEQHPLVGREAELARLVDAWSGAAGSGAAGSGRVTLVSGPAGVGKTRLVEELAGEAERSGGIVVRARCLPSTERLAMAPVVEWLRDPAIRHDIDHLDDALRTELARLRPELGDAQPLAVEPEGAWQRRRLFDAAARALLGAGRATLLVLDDLHWCDLETLDFLSYLLRSGKGDAHAVVATMRIDALQERTELAGWVAACAAEGLIDEQRLAPLPVEDTARLAAALDGGEQSGADPRGLHRRTGGLPLLVVESLRGGSGGGRAAALLTTQLSSLSPGGWDVCALTASAGRAVSLGLLTAASDLDADDVVEAVEELWDAGMLREGPGNSFELAHDLLRDAAYESLGAPQRQHYHRVIASALEELHGDDLRPVAAELCEHHRRAGQPERALTYHWIAARAAAAVLGHREAVRHHNEAIALLDELGDVESSRRADALVRLGVAQRTAGDPAHLQTLLDGAAMARRQGAADVLVRSALAAGSDGYWSAPFAADPEQAGLVRAALDLWPEGATPERVALSARLAIELHLDGDHVEAVELVEQSERSAREIGQPGPLLDALGARAFVRQDPESIREMPNVGRTCVELAARLGDRVRLVHELLRWDAQLRKVGRTDEADVALERAETLADSIDHPPTSHWVVNGRLAAALIAGDADRAEDLAARTVAAGEAAGVPDARRRALYATMTVHQLRDRLGELAPFVDVLTSPPHTQPVLRAGSALVLAHAGRHDEAREVLVDMTARLDDLPPMNNPHMGLALLARTAHQLGEPEPAARILERLRPHGGLVLYVGGAALGTTDHALGLAAAAADAQDEALGHLCRAADLERRAGMHGWLAHTERELARFRASTEGP